MLKKLLTYSVVLTTMVWSVGLMAMPVSVGAAVSGDLVKRASSSAVYYLGADSKLHVFFSAADYYTWYSDFSGVKTISETEFSSYGLPGENVFPRPGVKLVQAVEGQPWHTYNANVYALSGDGITRKIASAAVAAAIFGANWETQIIPVDITIFSQFATGADINSASDYDKASEMNNASSINDVKNLGNGNVSTGTSLTVSLASDTPASGIVVGNTINNKFTKVNLTASADGDIVIDSLVVRRGGTVASDGAFSTLEILDGATMMRIGDTKTINSTHMATFNEDIKIPAGTTKSIYLAGNMGSLATKAGEIPSLDLYSVTLTGNAAVIGSLPIVGNYQNLNGTITVGALTVANGTNNPSASTQKIGTTKYIVSGIKLTANSVEDFKVSSLTFNEGGTAGDADVANLQLLADDVVVATVANPTSKNVVFNLSASPVLVAKGKSVQFDVRLDIADGSARTIRFDVKDESDVVAKGQLYGSEVKASAGTGATADADPFWTAPITTVSTGTLRIGPATLSAANVPNSSTQVVLGKFEFEAKGEPSVITSLPIAFTVTTSSGNLSTDSTVDLTNVTLYDENGLIVAGPIDPVSKGTPGNNAKELLVATSTDTLTVPVGVHTYTVKGDLDSDFGSNDTIVARINPGQVTDKGDTTAVTISATPTTDQSSATMTVQSAQLSVSVLNTPVASQIVAGTKNLEFANISLGTQSSGEDIKVTTIKVAIHTTGAAYPAQVSNWSIYDGATKLAVTSDPDSNLSSTAAAASTSTFTLSTPLVLTKGTSKTLTVKGDVAASATSGSIKAGMADSVGADNISAKGNGSGTDASITMSVSDGQAMTLNSVGTLTLTLDTSSPKTGLMPGAPSSGLTFAVWNASAQYEAVNIEKIYLTATAANSGGWDQIAKVYIYDGSTMLASVAPTSSDGTAKTVLIDVTNSPIQIPKDSSKKLTIKVDTTAADAQNGSTGTSGQGLAMTITAAGDVTAKGAQSGTTVSSITLTGIASNTQYLYRTVPTIATNDLLSSGKVSSGTLDSGTAVGKDLYAFSVTAGSTGDLALYDVSFYVATNTATITNMVISDGTNNVAYQPTGGDIAGFFQTQDVGTDAWNGATRFVFVSDFTAPASSTAATVVPYTIAANTTKTFTLRGDVACVTVGGSVCSGASGSGSLSVQLMGNTAAPATYPVAIYTLSKNIGQLYSNSFIWSDLTATHNAGISDPTATTSSQWTNGAYVALTNGGKLQATSTAVTFSK
ncbi:MAG: hypothetical protein PHW95_00560 [Patescibacteria group bacterium]|nr:hypothetical protein [Patescibacteria group bacterium]